MWKPYRRAIEILQAVILTGLPFLTINGQSALRFDIPTLKLYVFGSVFWSGSFDHGRVKVAVILTQISYLNDGRWDMY